MCRMSLLGSTTPITSYSLERQLSHVKSMAQGENGVPYKYGDFVDGPTYDPKQKLLHTDSFGFYISSDNKEINEKLNRSVNSVNYEIIKSKTPTDPYISLMHARLATQGNKDNTNIQPFNLRNIVGMHNGSLEGLARDGKSDSDYILNSIDQNIKGEDIEKTLVSIAKECTNYGAMNLIIHDKARNEIVVICSYDENGVHSTNHKLYYQMVITKDGKQIYVSSEKDANEGSPKIYTKNHTMYIINLETGKTTEVKLSQLENEIKSKNKMKKKKKVKEANNIDEGNNSEESQEDESNNDESNNENSEEGSDENNGD
jgi:predicted glutamine amidotransferase